MEMYVWMLHIEKKMNRSDVLKWVEKIMTKQMVILNKNLHDVET